jgi:hypothetical protein
MPRVNDVAARFDLDPHLIVQIARERGVQVDADTELTRRQSNGLLRMVGVDPATGVLAPDSPLRQRAPWLPSARPVPRAPRAGDIAAPVSRWAAPAPGDPWYIPGPGAPVRYEPTEGPAPVRFEPPSSAPAPGAEQDAGRSRRRPWKRSSSDGRRSDGGAGPNR